MRVLHVINRLSTGGAERALYNLLKGGLADTGDHAVVSLLDEGRYGPLLRQSGVSVHSLGMKRGLLPGRSAISAIRGIVRGLRPDLVQGWMYHGNLAASVAGWLSPTDAAVAWNVRQSLYDLAWEKRLTGQVIRVNRFLSGTPDAVVYNSRLSRQQHEAFGFASGNAYVVPNGFDTANLKPDCETGRIMRRRLNIPEDALLVGHLARFHPMKDHAGFLRAAVNVAERCPDAHFLLAGKCITLANPVFEGLVPEALLDRFRFLGERDDPARLIQALDVLVSSSAWGEAFPNVLGEAMASGVPCVATDVGDSADIVGDTGAVVAPGDTHALVEALMSMYSKGENGRYGLGQLARIRIEENYGLPAIVARYEQMYESLIVR